MTISLSAARWYLLIFVSLCAMFYAATLVQLPWLFEEGAYDQYTASILEDGDFNIINQRAKDDPLSWIVTPTGNDVEMSFFGVSVYLAPFFAYRYALDPVIGADTAAGALRFADVHVLSSVFYVACAMIVLWRLFTRLGIRHFRKALAISALSTPFVWHLAFASTNVNIFALAYSILALTYFGLVRSEKRDPTCRELAILGLSAGVGITIHPQLVWIGFLPLGLLWERRGPGARGLLAALSGIAVPLLLLAADMAVRYGSLSIFFLSSARNGAPATFWNSLGYFLTGPNGYFYIAPIYFFAALALLCGTLRKHPLGPIPALVVLLPVGMVLLQAYSGAMQDTLGGRHFLEFFFLLVLIVASAFRALEKRSRRWLYAGLALAAALVVWNAVIMASYYHSILNGGWQWFMGGQVSPAHAMAGLRLLLSKMTSDRILLCFGKLFFHLPLILALSLGLQFLLRAPVARLKPVLSAFFLCGLLVFSVFTAMNLANHPRNVAEYRRNGFYDDKVVGNNLMTFWYDGAVEAATMVLLYQLKSGRCDIIAEDLNAFHRFLARVKEGVAVDPIGFVTELDKGILRRSAYVDPDVPVGQLEHDLREKCGRSIL